MPSTFGRDRISGTRMSGGRSRRVRPRSQREAFAGDCTADSEAARSRRGGMGRQADIPAWHFPAAEVTNSLVIDGCRDRAVINPPCRRGDLTRWSILLIFQEKFDWRPVLPGNARPSAAKGSGLRGRRATAATLTPRCAPSVSRIRAGQFREVERVGAADDDDPGGVFRGDAGFDAKHACACVSALARGNWTCRRRVERRNLFSSQILELDDQPSDPKT
jgi:hypothetical protein